MTEAPRSIANPYPDFHELTPSRRAQISRAIHARVDAEIRSLVSELRPKVCGPAEASDPAFNEGDFTLYLGAGGLALALWEAANYLASSAPELATACQRDGERALAHGLALASETESASGCGFYCGVPGLHALAAKMGESLAEHTARALEGLGAALAQPETELLYGRAGYLHSLFLLRQYTPPDRRQEALDAALDAVFDSLERDGSSLGESLARSFPDDPLAQSPLAFAFPRQKPAVYFGAAHGLAGVLYAMLQLEERCLRAGTRERVVGALDFLLAAQDERGNFPVGHRIAQPALVHWCHGAPGIIPTLCKAYEVLGDERFLRAACRAGDCVWREGLLRKGLGVCHGISGSILGLLTLYRTTGQERDLYRALRLCEATWSEHCLAIIASSPEPQRYVPGMPDFPYSLMEGKAGVLCAYLAIQRPDRAGFPGYCAL